MTKSSEDMVQRYLFIKRSAYLTFPLYKQLSDEQRAFYLEDIKYERSTMNFRDEEEKTIFINTFLIPNDYQFCREYKDPDFVKNKYRIDDNQYRSKCSEVFILQYLLKSKLLDIREASQDYDDNYYVKNLSNSSDEMRKYSFEKLRTLVDASSTIIAQTGQTNSSLSRKSL